MREYLHIEFDRADRTYRVGENVSGKVLISSPRGDQCEVVWLRSFWRTHGKGNVDKGQPAVTRLHSGPLSTELLHEFEFEFPAPLGPYSYDGRFLNVGQYVEVQVEFPWAGDVKQKEKYVLLPGKPVAPPPALLEARVGQVEKLVPGCSAALGSIAMVVGVIAIASVGAMGLLFLLAGGAFYLPYFKTRAEQKLGKSASAYLTSLVVSPEEEVEVEVRVAPPKPVQLNRAYLQVKAQEVCTFGSSSGRRVHHHKVFSAIQQLSGPVTLEGGKVRILKGSVQLPEGAPNSFKGRENKLFWEATVWLDIPSWPDWVKKIPFVVWPGEDLLPRAAEMEALPASTNEPIAPEPEPQTEIDPEPELEIESEPELEHERAHEAGVGPAQKALVEPQIEVEAEPEVEEKWGAPSGSLKEAVAAILDAEIFRGEKDLLIKDFKGKAFEFTLEVKRVDRSFGAFSASEYRNGQTVTGTVLGSDLEVAVFFPENRNEEVKGWESGSSHSVRGEVRDWDRLRKRPELLAKG